MHVGDLCPSAVEVSQETIMQTSSFVRILQRGVALAALAGGVSVAQAGGVYWAVKVDAPSHGGGRVGTTISNSPRGLHGPAPVIVAPPVVVAPQPVYQVGYHPGHGARPPAYHRHHGWWGARHRHGGGYHHGYRHGYREGHRDARYAERDDDRQWGRGDWRDDDGWRGHR